MVYKILGRVISLDVGCFEWTVQNFLGESCHESCDIRSPYISFSGAFYSISISVKLKENMIDLCFLWVRHKPVDKLHVRLGMRTGYKGKMETRSAEFFTRTNLISLGGWMQFSELLARRCEILPEGQLTVFCELRNLDVKENPPVQKEFFMCGLIEVVRVGNEGSDSDSDDDDDTVPETLKKLQKDLKNLFTSGEDCDVTIKVQEKEFPAHRGILRARSPVFNSMFSHEMVEKLSGVVVIDDCDPAIFPDFLNYLYTGRTKHISDENVCQLYTVSDKYQVAELKKECAAFLKAHMSVDIFCDILTLAIRHTEKELIDFSTQFFCANAKEIGKTVKWQTFLRENSEVGNELFLKALSRGGSI